MDEIQSSTPLNHHGTPLLRILALLLFALAIAVVSSLTTYYLLSKQLQSRSETELSQAPLVSKNSKQILAQPTTAVSQTEEEVIQVAKDSCEAQVDSQGNQRKFILDKIRPPSEKKVVYSRDRKFAQLEGRCVSDAEKEGVSGAVHIFKKVNSSWVLVIITQQANSELQQRYGWPNEFY